MSYMYKKIVCRCGYENIYAPNAPFPKKCGKCARPLNIKVNKPIDCDAHGNTSSVDEDRLYQENDSIISLEGDWNFKSSTVSEQTKISEQDLWKDNSSPKGRNAGGAIEWEVPTGNAGSAIEWEVPTGNAGSAVEWEVSTGNSEGNFHSDLFARDEQEDEKYGDTFRKNGTQSTSGGIVLITNGFRIPLEGDYLYLGRDHIGSEAFSANNFISRKHAKIQILRNQMISVSDENSLNGTFVDRGNGKNRVLPGKTETLKSGDSLWLANQMIIVEKY